MAKLIGSKKLAVLAILGAFTAGSAQAAIQVKEAALGNGLASNKLTVPVYTGNIWSGFQTIMVKDTVLNTENSFEAFCVDPYEFSSSSYTTYTIGDLNTAFSASVVSNIKKLYNFAYAGSLGPSAAADINAGALQLALWEVIADSTTDILNGNVKAYTGTGGTNTTLLSATQTLLTNYGSYSGPDLYDFTLYQSIGSPGKQDFLVATTLPPPPVPEPEVAALMLAGLGLIGGMAKRRKTRKQ